MRGIFNAIKSRIDEFSNKIAQGINCGDWGLVARSVGVVLLAVCAVVAICLLALFGIWELLHSFWGKKLLSMVGGALLLYILVLSYRANKDESKEKIEQEVDNHLGVWAEAVYEYVRDALFLVLRAVSEYTEIVMPTSPGMVELPNAISIKDGYAVFNFFARVRNPVDAASIKRDLTRTLSQMQRAHELKGISSDLVQINGAYYCPLQILDIIDFGDSITISVVFADEKTIAIAKACKLLNLEQSRGQSRKNSGVPYDDQL